MKAPQYRICKVTDGLGDITYHPEFKAEGAATWDSIYLTQTNKESGTPTLGQAKHFCDSHKVKWLRSQVAEEVIINYIPNGVQNG